MSKSIWETEFTSPQNETKKLNEIIDNNDFGEVKTPDGIVLNRFIRRSGVFKLAKFLGVKFGPMQILQTPDKWNNYNYAVGVTAYFPSEDFEYFDIGESSRMPSAPENLQTHHLTYAFDRAKKRAILNSPIVGLYQLLTEEESEILEKGSAPVNNEKNLLQSNSNTSSTDNKLTHTPREVDSIDELDLNSFIIPSGEFEGKSVFDVLRIGADRLKDLRLEYPQNLKFSRILDNLAKRVRNDEDFETNTIEEFEDEFLQKAKEIAEEAAFDEAKVEIEAEEIAQIEAEVFAETQSESDIRTDENTESNSEETESIELNLTEIEKEGNIELNLTEIEKEDNIDLDLESVVNIVQDTLNETVASVDKEEKQSAADNIQFGELDFLKNLGNK